MPRPKVRAEDRRRAVIACVPCQNSKKRCDGQTPCANCRRRDYVPYCIYDPEAARPRRKAQRRAMSRSSDITASGNDDCSSLDYIVCSDVALSVNERDTPERAQAPQTPESTAGQQTNETPDTAFSSCMSNVEGQDKGSDGENLSMGDSASLSFLDFLRHTFLRYMGPSPFTDKERAKAMLESSYPQASHDIADDSPDSQLTLEEKRDYIQRFLVATTGIIYIYSPKQLYELLEQTEDDSDSGSSKPCQKRAIIDLVIAVGGQGCRTSPKTLYHAQKHFDRGQKVAFEGMLLDPTADLVAIFLMMGIYMVNACKRDGAFIYLGVATRVAHAIGLHLPESYRNLSPETHRVRLQVWKSLRILDIAFGGVLAQTPASSPRRGISNPTFSVPDGPEPCTPEFTSMSACYGVCTILEQIIYHLNDKQDTNLSSIKDLLRQLREWSSALPSSMTNCTVSSSISPEQWWQTLGNFAVSAFYYYAVMLATRPILISYMLAKLKRLDRSDGTLGSHPTIDRETKELAQVCIDAAVLLVETTRRTGSAGLLIQNMTLLKAWIFSACLIMAFSLFVEATLSERSTTFETEAALHSGIGIIRDLDRTSPQAHRYIDVLTELRNALQSYRERLIPPRRKSSGQFLSQIFTLDQEKSTPAPDTEMTGLASAVVPPELGDESSGGLLMLQQVTEATQNMNNMWRIPDEGQAFVDECLPLSIGGLDVHWNGISVQGTDNFLFDTEPFTEMLSHF
ncbi:transcriptional regulatory [Fusarium pseudoanthophilum]|uniref:Transcriptional regulatory n=1 Tax=Fusarium pseudoanthophilum TaxID=48495 RepID=A0A8H5P081_9HYPO|nr:transcriptional regulatory [Fusarium pseudoanthophilum]